MERNMGALFLDPNLKYLSYSTCLLFSPASTVNLCEPLTLSCLFELTFTSYLHFLPSLMASFLTPRWNHRRPPMTTFPLERWNSMVFPTGHHLRVVPSQRMFGHFGVLSRKANDTCNVSFAYFSCTKVLFCNSLSTDARAC